MLDDHGSVGRWGLSAVALGAAALVLYFFWRTPRSDDRILGALHFCLPIVGNVTDRLRLGFVVDFIDVQFGSWHYPTFNVADMAIVIGAGLMIIDMFLSKRHQVCGRRTGRKRHEVAVLNDRRSENMREKIVDLILETLAREEARIRSDFGSDKTVKTKYCSLDGLLPEEMARQISEAFPDSGKMRLLDSFREKKYTSKSLDQFDPVIADITFAFQDKRVIEKVAELTGIKDAVGDPHLYAGGISAMAQGHFLQPHLDNSHDGEQKNYRVLNLLYYITPDWKRRERWKS